MFQICTTVLLLSPCIADYIPPFGEKLNPKPFHYEYGVPKQHMKTETQDEGGNISGEVVVSLPDGRIQTTTYSADYNTGYNAAVRYEGTPTYPDNGYQNIDHHMIIPIQLRPEKPIQTTRKEKIYHKTFPSSNRLKVKHFSNHKSKPELNSSERIQISMENPKVYNFVFLKNREEESSITNHRESESQMLKFQPNINKDLNEEETELETNNLQSKERSKKIDGSENFVSTQVRSRNNTKLSILQHTDKQRKPFKQNMKNIEKGKTSNISPIKDFVGMQMNQDKMPAVTQNHEIPSSNEKKEEGNRFIEKFTQHTKHIRKMEGPSQFLNINSTEKVVVLHNKSKIKENGKQRKVIKQSQNIKEEKEENKSLDPHLLPGRPRIQTTLSPKNQSSTTESVMVDQFLGTEHVGNISSKLFEQSRVPHMTSQSKDIKKSQDKSRSPEEKSMGQDSKDKLKLVQEALSDKHKNEKLKNVDTIETEDTIDSIDPFENIDNFETIATIHNIKTSDTIDAIHNIKTSDTADTDDNIDTTDTVDNLCDIDTIPVKMFNAEHQTVENFGGLLKEFETVENGNKRPEKSEDFTSEREKEKNWIKIKERQPVSHILLNFAKKVMKDNLKKQKKIFQKIFHQKFIK